MPENNDKKDWSAEFKFGYFFTPYLCMQGVESKINELESTFSCIKRVKKFFLRQNNSTRLLGAVFCSLYNKEFRTIHYSTMPQEWVANKCLAEASIFLPNDYEEKKKEVLRNFEEVVNQMRQSGLLKKGNWSDLVEFMSHLNNTPLLEDWFSFYSNLPCASDYLEEGMAYQYMISLAKEKQKSPSGFLMEEGVKNENGQKNGGPFHTRNVHPIFVKDAKVEEIKDCKNYDEAESTIAQNCLAKKITSIIDNLLDFLFRKGASDFYSKKPCLVFPIYESYIGNCGYGSIWGFYYFLLESYTEDQNLLQNIYNLVFPRLEEASQRIFASTRWRTEDRLSRGLVKGENQISQLFLENAGRTHSWENIWITNESPDPDTEIPKKNVMLHWGWEEGDFLEGIWGDKKENNNELPNGKPEQYFWWGLSELEWLFSSDFDQFNNEFRDKYIICEYPKLCFIPENEVDRKIFIDKIKEQQIQIFEVVLKKWRQRKSALRSSVSAIMGRNLSHNIGSHVLARYADVAGKKSEQRQYQNTDPPEAGPPRDIDDHRQVLLSYLQRRMDFIAEICTSDQAFLYQSLDLKGMLDKLNWKAAKSIINEENTEENNNFEPILLSYISGKQKLISNVEFLGDTDYSFSCPGGEVGAHALYTILENIMRNSARHNNNVAKEILLKVKVEEPEEYPDLLKLTIHDCQTKISNGKSNDLIRKLNTILGNEKTESNEDGDQDAKHYLLDENNKLNTANWGIQEIRICAHYLRGYKLTELEDKLSAPPVLEVIRGSCNLLAYRLPFSHLGKRNYLAYKLYLKRAQLCAIVLESECSSINSNVTEALRRQGIRFFCDNDVNTDELGQYDFLVLPKRKIAEYEEIRLQLPIRMLFLDQVLKDKVAELNINNLKQWIDYCIG